jgi:DNA repair protein RadA/Sms
VQVKAVATHLLQLAKSHDIAVIVLGHVTKSGDLAGPRVLEHMVDVVIEIGGDR